jgi:hypothetical protein
MTSADRDLDEFIERNVSPEVRPQARLGTILGPDDEGDAGLRYLVLLEAVGRAYSLTPDEFVLLDNGCDA